MPLRDLDEQDQRHFLSRLARYGVDQQVLRDEDLVVPRGTNLQLSHRTGGPLSPHMLITRDIDVVRKWIGVPEAIERVRFATPAVADVAAMPAALRPRQPTFGLDEVRRRATLRASTPGASAVRASELRATALRANTLRARGIAEGAEMASPERLDHRLLRHEELQELKSAAHAYIRGEQRMVGAYKSLLEAFYGDFQVAGWFFTTITVESGAVLELGRGANVLSAYKVVVEQGGTIRSKGTLTVDCTILSSPPTGIRIRPDLLDTVATRFGGLLPR